MRENNVLVIPNSAIAESTVVNYSTPTVPSRLPLPIVLDFSIPVARGIAVLTKAATSSVSDNGILADPSPRTVVVGVESYGVKYEVQVWHDMKTVSRDIASTAAIAGIIAHLQEQGIEVAIPREEHSVRHQDRPAPELLTAGAAE